MQVNLYNPLWKEFLKYLGWILLFVVLWFNGCNRTKIPSVSAKVTVPEVKGKFEAKKPVHHIVEGNKKVFNKNDKTVFVENPIDKKLIAENEKLKLDYEKANDSIKELLFNKVATLNTFSSPFEDENIVLNINGVVQGEVKEITPNYTIKAKKVEVPVKQKETVFRLLGGLEVGNNIQLNDFKVKANLMFQNRKGNIISGSFDTNQTVWVGYNVSLFNIKR